MARMTLLTAHKVLIACGTAFFLYFGLHRLSAYTDTGEPSLLLVAGGGLCASVALAVYYRTIGKPN